MTLELGAAAVDYESFNVLFCRPGYGSWGALASLVGPDYFAVFGEGGYRPLSTLVYFLTHAAFGPEPAAFRAVKLLLHAGCAAWVWSLCRTLAGGRLWPALAAAAYLCAFADPVFAGAAFVPDLLCAFLALAALRAHLGGRPPWTTAALTLAACLAKETALVLPGLLLAAELARPAPGGARALLRRHAPVWGAAALVVALAWWGARAGSYYGSFGGARLRPGLLLGYAGVFFRGPAAWALAAAAAGAAAAAARGRVPTGAWRPAALLLVWALLPLAPAVGLQPFPRLAAALGWVEPRYLALPGAALACLPAVLALRFGAGAAWRWAAAALLLAGAAAEARGVLARRAAWRSELVSGAEKGLSSGGAPLTGSRLGEALLSLPLLKDREPALYARLERALRAGLGSEADGALEWFGSASLYADPWKAGQAMRMVRAESVAELRRRLAAERSYEEGLRLLSEGRPEGALPAFTRAWEADGGHLPACFSAAEALARAGRQGDAGRRAAGCLAARRGAEPGRSPSGVELDARLSERAEALEGRAQRLVLERRYEAARQTLLETGRELDFRWPQRWAARRELDLLDSGARAAFDSAMDRFAAGERRAAAEGFALAVRLSPDFSEALLSRAALRADAGDWRGAQADGARALATAPTEELRRAAASALSTARARGRGA